VISNLLIVENQNFSFKIFILPAQFAAPWTLQPGVVAPLAPPFPTYARAYAQTVIIVWFCQLCLLVALWIVSHGRHWSEWMKVLWNSLTFIVAQNVNNFVSSGVTREDFLYEFLQIFQGNAQYLIGLNFLRFNSSRMVRWGTKQNGTTVFKQKVELKIIFMLFFFLWIGRIVCIVIRLWAGRSGIQFPAGQEVFLCKMYIPAPRPTHPPRSGYYSSLRAGKEPVHEPDHSPPSSAEVKSVEQCVLSPFMPSWWDDKPLNKLENVCRV
jgi:hypothetical protein